ncbi:DNA ligase D [Psychrobacillus vulpis]|uniref:DNA ligase D n=1 Tax=Psychrobacillus vulpis TaxID=2325572 RepID=A0A544TR43_9BACI|nr:DNA ligase D [Psychrobacillus vulpis]TQR19905.1 DNA ligase D [Psychrobacillus vulpis]
MKPMLLTGVDEIPLGKDWIYETKYDGFRCLLEWESEPILKSRNGKVLNNMFPEIISFCYEIHEQIKPYLPLTLDGELVYLINNWKSNFSIVQLRGRMSNQDVISTHVQQFPCHYVVFDLLKYKGESVTSLPITKRKQTLDKLFQKMKIPITINYEDKHRVQAIDTFQDSERLWNNIEVSNGEGIVAKRKTSNWESNTRTVNWVKIKNWRYVSVILIKYDKSNGYFHGAVYHNDELTEVVTLRHGLKEEELHTLIALFQSNGTKLSENIWELEPSICVDIVCIDFDGKHLREPRFHAFNFEIEAFDCNWQKMQRQLFPLPEVLQITHPEKSVWPASDIQKDDYLLYLQNITPYILPFLRERLLTVIRFPHGVPGESFYQKNSPDYIPDYITTKRSDDIDYILCNDVESLLWLGNQLALEFHIPFQTIQTNKPTEIVFDLDPPSVKEFSLAVEAAIRMKAIFDQFELQSFVKTSGGKGLQIYIPLPFDTYSYEDTRVFTEFVCQFLCEQVPQWFTIERLKKNRENKLYLDYIQHAEGKTIIAPYSTRGNDLGLVATPLNWEEVNSSLKPDMFSIPNVLERLKKQANPFRDFRENIDEKKFGAVLDQLKGLMKK